MAKRIPSLDGLRALSIILVVVSHSFSDLKHFADLGNLGVRMFFIISSFLIVGILSRDVDNGRFDLRKFYFKRIIRTFPAFYTYLMVLFISLYFFDLFDWDQLWRAPIYLENYHPRSHWNKIQWFVGHSWSLAVEEQFYLLISLVFLLFNNKWISKKTLLIIFCAVIVVTPIIRIAYFLIPQVPEVLRGSVHRSFETVADALAVGGLAYFFRQRIEKGMFF